MSVDTTSESRDGDRSVRASYLKSAAAPGIANSAVPVLIVDDNPVQRLALRAVLAPLGYHLVEADSGAAALRCLIKENFAVILLDVVMPGMDGFETAQLIRRRQQSELTPIIFVTAHDKEAMASAAAYATGAADFIFTPVPPEELRAKVGVFANLFLRAEFLVTEADRVRSSAGELTLLTDLAPIGIFRLDGDGKYTYVNRCWSELTGVGYQDAIGNGWDVMVGRAEAAAIRAAREASLAAPATTPEDYVPFSHRVRITRRDGHPARMVELTARPNSDSIDGSVGWVGTLSEVIPAPPEITATVATGHGAAPMDIEPATATELRELVASVLDFFEDVPENPTATAEHRRADVAHRSAQRLGVMIDDLTVVP